MLTTTAPAVPDTKHGRTRALCAAGGALAAAAAGVVEVPLLGIHLDFRFGTGHIQTIAVGQVIGVSLAASLLGWLLSPCWPGGELQRGLLPGADDRAARRGRPRARCSGAARHLPASRIR